MSKKKRNRKSSGSKNNRVTKNNNSVPFANIRENDLLSSPESDERKEQMREALRNQREKQLNKEKKRRIAIGSSVLVLIAALIAGVVWISLANNGEIGEQLTPEKVDINGAFHVSSEGVIEETTPTGRTRVDIFFDPMCPGCGLIHRGIDDRLNELVDNGEIDLYFTPVSFLDQSSSDQYSTRAVNATITVAEESPEHYLDFLNVIFETGNQPQQGANYVSVTDELLAERAVSLGVPEDVAEKFKEGHYYDRIRENTSTQLNDRDDLFPEPNGFSTPAVFLNIGYENKETHSGDVVDYTKVDFDSPEIQEAFDEALSEAKSEE